MTLRENIADRISGGKISELQVETEQIKARDSERAKEFALLQENLGRLEALLYSDEWRMLRVAGHQEFSRQGVNEIIELSRLMRLKNPIIQRGVEVQRLYVWAQGIRINATHERIEETIQDFLEDSRNKTELTSHQARGEKEVELQQDGNLFFRFFIDERTGRIRIRTIDPIEVEKIVCNPEDKKEPWLYRRLFTTATLSGQLEQHAEYYPDWRYNPIDKPEMSDGIIDWETPIYHIKVNSLGRFGIPEYYSALDWSLAYKRFLEQLAAVWSALARWSHKLTGIRSATELASTKAKIGSTLTEGGLDETNPPPLTGSVALLRDGRNLEPFRTSGATMKADDGRRLMLMALQVFGFPETFYSDVSVGTLATAKSLDRPTELKITDRQQLWKDIHAELIRFVMFWAVKAPKGPLRSLGAISSELDGNERVERVIWNENVDATVTIDFPPIVEQDVKDQVTALADALTLRGQTLAGTIPLETAVRRFLTLLGFSDIEAIMAEWKKAQEEEEEQPDAQGDQSDQPPPENVFAQALNNFEASLRRAYVQMSGSNVSNGNE